MSGGGGVAREEGGGKRSAHTWLRNCQLLSNASGPWSWPFDSISTACDFCRWDWRILPHIKSVSGDGFVTSSELRFLAIWLLLIAGSFKKYAFRVASSGIASVRSCFKISLFMQGTRKVLLVEAYILYFREEKKAKNTLMIKRAV